MSSLFAATFALLTLLGVPLFLMMGGLALVLFANSGIDSSALSIEMYRLAGSPAMVTIPLFTLAGYFLAESSSPKRLFNFANALLGHLPGGLAIVSLCICAFFTAFTGASGVTIIALGALIYPILLKQGYARSFSLGLVTTTGSLGLLFPPSLPLILYAIVAKIDVDKLFLSGILPGIFLVLILSAWSIYNARNLPKRAFTGWAEVRKTFMEVRYELLIPILLLGGIYGGIFTTSEAAAATLLYVIVMEFFLYRDLDFKKDFLRICQESMSLVGAILIILCCAMGLTNYLIDEEIPMKILAMVREFITDKYTFLLVLNIFLLIVGALMDIFSAIIVVLPLILPIAQDFGIHPYHLAIIFLTNLEIGYITPPVGINLFISSFRFERPMLEIYRSVVPYIAILIIALLVIIYVPFLSLAFI
jgi:C4-dicarboxylate transporter DctM subunit